MQLEHCTRINQGGNYCGHSPLVPTLELEHPIKKGQGGLPRILSLVSEKIEDYFHSPSLLPTLNLANGSKRQQRSERREACVRLIKAMIKHMDINTLRVGVPTASGFKNLDTKFFSKHTNLSLRRCQRAMNDLKRSGLVQLSEIKVKTATSEFRSYAAIKKISKHLFSLLNIDRVLASEQKKASKRVKKDTLTHDFLQQQSTTTGIKRKSPLKGLMKDLSQATKPKQKSAYYQKLWTETVLELHKKAPETPLQDIRHQADAILKNRK